jgi:hypothetical protein
LALTFFALTSLALICLALTNLALTFFALTSLALTCLPEEIGLETAALVVELLVVADELIKDFLDTGIGLFLTLIFVLLNTSYIEHAPCQSLRVPDIPCKRRNICELASSGSSADLAFNGQMGEKLFIAM